MIHATAGGSSTDAIRRRSLKALIALAAVAAVSVPAAQATSPGPNGRIAFMRPDANGLWQVWTANPDLTAAQQLTAGGATSGWPGWAPHGERIAFDSDRADPDPTDDVFVNDVFTMRADGTNVTKLTDSVGFSGDPAYSPDGELIAFDADRGIRSGDPGWTSANADLSIYVTDAIDGHPTRRVTTPPAGTSDTEPRFAPDGSKLVFTRFRGGHRLDSGRIVGDTSAVFVVRVDGTRPRRITGWGARTGQADWSPDGSRIVFEDVGDYLGNTDVYTVRADGSGLAKLTHGAGITGIGSLNALRFEGFYDPVWSPDGTKVLLGHQLLEADGAFREGLAVINANGTNLDWAAPNPQIEHQPDWGTAPLR